MDAGALGVLQSLQVGVEGGVGVGAGRKVGRQAVRRAQYGRAGMGVMMQGQDSGEWAGPGEKARELFCYTTWISCGMREAGNSNSMA